MRQSSQTTPCASANCSRWLSASRGENATAYQIAPVTMAAFPTTALSQYIQTV